MMMKCIEGLTQRVLDRMFGGDKGIVPLYEGRYDRETVSALLESLPLSTAEEKVNGRSIATLAEALKEEKSIIVEIDDKDVGVKITSELFDSIMIALVKDNQISYDLGYCADAVFVAFQEDVGSGKFSVALSLSSGRRLCFVAEDAAKGFCEAIESSSSNSSKKRVYCKLINKDCLTERILSGQEAAMI
ncbi:MAG: hypothetical protein PHI66_04785 [Candidatus Pacebacteria bacterium]|jgi:hypothetical protein|nr:hypothetical protein [Candidatus Paceibacterota bacterium]